MVVAALVACIVMILLSAVDWTVPETTSAAPKD
jgi:hypothetical protein